MNVTRPVSSVVSAETNGATNASLVPSLATNAPTASRLAAEPVRLTQLRDRRSAYGSGPAHASACPGGFGLFRAAARPAAWLCGCTVTDNVSTVTPAGVAAWRRSRNRENRTSPDIAVLARRFC